MSKTLDFMNVLNESAKEVKKPIKRLEESEDRWYEITVNGDVYDQVNSKEEVAAREEKAREEYPNATIKTVYRNTNQVITEDSSLAELPQMDIYELLVNGREEGQDIKTNIQATINAIIEEYPDVDRSDLEFYVKEKAGEVYEPLDGQVLTEDESDGKIIYMNTWANYNENGADLSKYGIENGWLTIDGAKEFASKYAEDEPFINDIDIELPFEVNEYSSLDILDEIEDYLGFNDYEREVIAAIIEATGDDYEDAKGIYEQGDYTYYPGIDNDYDLGYEVISGTYGINSIPEDLLERYFDFEALGRDIRLDYYQEDDLPETAGEYWCGDEDASDYDIGQAFVDEVGSDGVANADNYFDFDSFGSDLGYDGFTFTDNGVIEIY